MTEKEKKIPPSKLRDLFTYDPDTGALVWNELKRGRATSPKQAGYINPNGYQYIMIDCKNHHGHRIAWAYYYNEWPEGEIDHINGIRNDNRINNLRVVSRRGNSQNRLEHRNGRLPGCYFKNDQHRKNPWQVKIQVDGKRRHIGYFMTEQQAHQCYMEAVKKLKEGAI